METTAKISLMLYIAWNIDQMIWGRDAWWRY